MFESLYFWGNFLCSVNAENPNGIDDVGWSWVFDFFLFNDDQLCLITLRVRASYLRVWTFKATFYAQWKPRILMALTMLAEVEFSIFFCSMMSSCAVSLCACGRRIWDSELLRPLFMLSERRESQWHWRCWLKLSFCFFFVQWWRAVGRSCIRILKMGRCNATTHFSHPPPRFHGWGECTRVSVLKVVQSRRFRIRILKMGRCNARTHFSHPPPRFYGWGECIRVYV